VRGSVRNPTVRRSKQVRRIVVALHDLRSSRVRDILFVTFVASCSRIRTLTQGNEGNEVGVLGEENSLFSSGPPDPCQMISAELLSRARGQRTPGVFPGPFLGPARSLRMWGRYGHDARSPRACIGEPRNGGQRVLASMNAFLAQCSGCAPNLIESRDFPREKKNSVVVARFRRGRRIGSGIDRRIRGGPDREANGPVDGRTSECDRSQGLRCARPRPLLENLGSRRQQ
jgi:hypothetical protein